MTPVPRPMSMLSDIAAIYRDSKKKTDINWWTEWVCRPPAAVVVYAVRNTPVTPNQLTFASLFIAAIAGVMWMLLPGYGWSVAAVVVFELSFVFDCADGQLARVRKTASTVGHLLDFLMDEIKAMFLFVCITIRLWRFSGDANEALYLIGGLAGLLALASGLSLTSFIRRPEYGAPAPTEEGQPAAVSKRSGIGAALSLVEHAARFVVHYPSYIWLACLVNRIDIYFWAYAAVNVLYFGRTFLSILLRLGRFAR